MKKLISSAAVATTLLAATPAFAGGSEHSHGLMANIMHWLSAPHHAGMAIIAATVIAGFGVAYALRKKA